MTSPGSALSIGQVSIFQAGVAVDGSQDQLLGSLTGSLGPAGGSSLMLAAADSVLAAAGILSFPLLNNFNGS